MFSTHGLMVGPGLRQANQVNKFRFPFVQKETASPLFVDLLINLSRERDFLRKIFPEKKISWERDFLRKGNQNWISLSAEDKKAEKIEMRGHFCF